MLSFSHNNPKQSLPTCDRGQLSRLTHVFWGWTVAGQRAIFMLVSPGFWCFFSKIEISEGSHHSWPPEKRWANEWGKEGKLRGFFLSFWKLSVSVLSCMSLHVSFFFSLFSLSFSLNFDNYLLQELTVLLHFLPLYTHFNLFICPVLGLSRCLGFL